jgi:ParB-like chromosome segregation protein Spo0J
LYRKGEWKLEFIKLKIDQLVHAEYNPRKDLKAGDPEFEKIKNSMNSSDIVNPSFAIRIIQ